jgi:hypothetical protein
MLCSVIFPRAPLLSVLSTVTTVLSFLMGGENFTRRLGGAKHFCRVGMLLLLVVVVVVL